MAIPSIIKTTTKIVAISLPLITAAQTDKTAATKTVAPKTTTTASKSVTTKTPTTPQTAPKTNPKSTVKTPPSTQTPVAAGANAQATPPTAEPVDYYGDQDSRTFGVFEKGKTAYTLATDVNIREQPTADAKILGTLPIGTAVKIEEQLEKTYKKNGFSAPWHKISYTDNGTKQTGFVWGGMLTQTIVHSKQADGTVFLLGISSLNKEKMQGVLQLRAARNGVELTKMEMKSRATFEQSGMHVQGASLGTAGFTKGVNDALMFGIGYEACSYTQSDRLVIWDGKQFFDGWEATTVSDAGVGSEANTIVFPNEKEGKPQSIVVKYESTTYDDNEKEITTRSQWTYKWNGRKFVKQ